jgi:hypothetical protein
MTEWLFKTPTVLEGPAGQSRLFYFYKIDRGISIVRQTNGTWKQIRFPVDGDLDLYPVAYRGGYEYTVDDATRESLINGNVGVTTENFTEL